MKHSFCNSAGAEVLIDGKMTLRELIDAGVISIRLSKESDPLELNWWRESGSVDCEHCKGRSERDRAKCAICSGTGKVVPAHTKKVKRMVCKEGV